MTPARLPTQITIVGMGYVGLPLAVAFSCHVRVTGYDRSERRVEALKRGEDHNREVPAAELAGAGIEFTSDSSCLRDAEFIIVTVPTPVDDKHEPDLGPLLSASEVIGDQLRKRSPGLASPVIVFESTTFPGCTEEACAPVIAKNSGLEAGQGFKLGYSPERTDFGDPQHGLGSIIKVVSGQDGDTADLVQAVYDLICPAGTHRAPDIRTAEAAKVIENIQRDLNIALVNELAMVFDRLGIATSDVLAAAATKWNFMPFRPGLVGGHCIPVDPYYLTHKARSVHYEPEVVLAGRRVNESMAGFIAEKIRLLVDKPDIPSVLVLGLAFKPNISDARNSKIADLASELAISGAIVSVHDPRAFAESFREYGLTPAPDPFAQSDRFDAVVLATPHDEFTSRPLGDLTRLVADRGVIVDITGALDRAGVESLGARYWRP